MTQGLCRGAVVTDSAKRAMTAEGMPDAVQLCRVGLLCTALHARSNYTLQQNWRRACKHYSTGLSLQALISSKPD